MLWSLKFSFGVNRAQISPGVVQEKIVFFHLQIYIRNFIFILRLECATAVKLLVEECFQVCRLSFFFFLCFYFCLFKFNGFDLDCFYITIL